MWQIATKCWNPLSGAKPRWCPSTKMRIKLHWKFYFVNHLCMWNESYNHHIILQVFRSQIWMYCCAQSYASGFFLCFSPFKSIVLLASRVSNRVSLIFTPVSRTHAHTHIHTHTHLLLISIMDGDKVNVFFEWLSLYLSSCYIFLGSLKFPGYPAFIRILAHKY